MENFIDPKDIESFRATLHDIADFYGRFLHHDAGESTPERDRFIGIMTEIRAIAEGAPITTYGAMCIAEGARHYYRNAIPFEELRLPPPRKAKWAHKALGQLCQDLRPLAESYGEGATLIVADLERHIFPQSPEELIPFTLLLQLGFRKANVKIPELNAEAPENAPD